MAYPPRRNALFGSPGNCEKWVSGGEGVPLTMPIIGRIYYVILSRRFSFPHIFPRDGVVTVNSVSSKATRPRA